MRYNSPPIIEYPDRYREAVEGRIKANATTGRRRRWFAADPTRETLMEQARVTSNGFAMKMVESFDEWGHLTEGQERALRKALGEHEAKKAEWRAQDRLSAHQGEVGKRATFAVTVIGIFEEEGAYGVTYAIKMKDAGGNIFHWRASGHAHGLEKGQTVNIKATVKSHHTSKAGVKSTILTRGAVEAAPVEAPAVVPGRLTALAAGMESQQ